MSLEKYVRINDSAERAESVLQRIGNGEPVTLHIKVRTEDGESIALTVRLDTDEVSVNHEVVGSDTAFTTAAIGMLSALPASLEALLDEEATGVQEELDVAIARVQPASRR